MIFYIGITVVFLILVLTFCLGRIAANADQRALQNITKMIETEKGRREGTHDGDRTR